MCAMAQRSCKNECKKFHASWIKELSVVFLFLPKQEHYQGTCVKCIAKVIRRQQKPPLVSRWLSLLFAFWIFFSSRLFFLKKKSWTLSQSAHTKRFGSKPFAKVISRRQKSPLAWKEFYFVVWCGGVENMIFYKFYVLYWYLAAKPSRFLYQDFYTYLFNHSVQFICLCTLVKPILHKKMYPDQTALIRLSMKSVLKCRWLYMQQT